MVALGGAHLDSHEPWEPNMGSQSSFLQDRPLLVVNGIITPINTGSDRNYPLIKSYKVISTVYDPVGDIL